MKPPSRRVEEGTEENVLLNENNMTKRNIKCSYFLSLKKDKGLKHHPVQVEMPNKSGVCDTLYSLFSQAFKAPYSKLPYTLLLLLYIVTTL